MIVHPDSKTWFFNMGNRIAIVILADVGIHLRTKGLDAHLPEQDISTKGLEKDLNSRNQSQHKKDYHIGKIETL